MENYDQKKKPNVGSYNFYGFQALDLSLYLGGWVGGGGIRHWLVEATLF